MKGIARPLIRDRIKLAWVALFSSDRSKIEDASESVLYPPTINKLFNDFYNYIERDNPEIWKATIILDTIQKATGPCENVVYARNILRRLEECT